MTAENFKNCNLTSIPLDGTESLKKNSVSFKSYLKHTNKLMNRLLMDYYCRSSGILRKFANSPRNQTSGNSLQTYMVYVWL